MYLWNTHRLATALGHQELTGAEKFKYFLLLQAIGASAGYIAWLFVSTSGGWAFWFEAAMFMVITIAGLKRCRERYALALHDRFIEDCIILMTPLTIKFLILFWLAHVAIPNALNGYLHYVMNPQTNEEFIKANIIFKSVHGAYPFFLMFLGNALYFIRLSKHMETAAREQRP